MIVTIGARGTRSSGLSGFWFSASICSSASACFLTSSSQPNSRAMDSAMSGSRTALMVTSNPWPISLPMRSVERTPIASDRERTVIGSCTGTLPLRGMVGLMVLGRKPGRRLRWVSVSSSRRPTPPRLGSGTVWPSLRAFWRSLRSLCRSSRPATPGVPRRWGFLAPPFSPPSSSSSISSTTAPGFPGVCCCKAR